MFRRASQQLFSRKHVSSLFVASLVVYGSHGAHQRRILKNESSSTWPEGSTAANTKGSKALTAPKGTEEAQESSSSFFGGGHDSTWSIFSEAFSAAGTSVSSIEWSSVGSAITDYILPEWAAMLPTYIRKLQAELNTEPGSLSEEILLEAEDEEINPEVQWTARVRFGTDLCREEKAFQRRRRKYVRHALARYLDIPYDEIHPDDIPTIAMCGSGGGIRALIAACGSYMCTQEAGLFDCVTYLAGVSGSCWLLSLFYSSIGAQNHSRVVEHLKSRVGVHIAFPPTALSLLTTAPTNKFLLSGLLEKARGDPKASFGLVDIFGLLLGARLLVPKGELGVNAVDLKVSNQQRYVESGAYPMPIYTAVRHEIPLNSAEEKAQASPSESTKELAKQESWFQWFETTPWEFWCEEFEAGIPIWSLGRQFDNGVHVPRDNGLGLPEIRIPQLMGIWGSAFTATLSHYYREIRPAVQSLAGFTNLDSILTARNDDLIKVHPIEPASVPNFVFNVSPHLLPATTPRSVLTDTHLQLMDAGMSNNLPIYPLLRPGRNVDVLIAFDASADSRTDNWLSVAEGYAKQRGIKGWPIGIGWPRAETSAAQASRDLEAAAASSAEDAASKLADARNQQQQQQQQQRQQKQQHQQRDEKSATTTTSSLSSSSPSPPATDPSNADLDYCTVWVGTTEERTSSATSTPPSKRFATDADWALLGPDAGIAVVYFPLLANARVPAIEPDQTDFLSTWNFVYTPAQVDGLVALVRANWEEGAERTRRAVRAVYEQKRRRRLGREERLGRRRWEERLRERGDGFA